MHLFVWLHPVLKLLNREQKSNHQLTKSCSLEERDEGRFPGSPLIHLNLSLYALHRSVRIVKNCDRGLENAARGRRPRAAFSSPRSDPKPVNNLFIFLEALKRKNSHGKQAHASVTVAVVENQDRGKSGPRQESIRLYGNGLLDCRIRYRARLEKK